MQENDIITDGAAKFKVVSKSMLHWFDTIHPVGSVYATTKKGTPFELGEWELVGQDGTLWGVGEDEEAGQKKEAGLPNITGHVGGIHATFEEPAEVGALYFGSTPETKRMATQDGAAKGTVMFSAARSNAIYGKSNTVQSPAYTVYFWHRIA